MGKNKKMNICLAASAGGHLSQLLKLSDSWKGCDVFCVTTSKVVKNELQAHGKVYIVRECNRKHPLRLMKTMLQCARIIIRQRPFMVISTGAAVGCITCFLAKITGARIVWIDSITNIEKLSLSGRMVRLIADLFLVQWPGLTQKYTDVEYAGALI